MLALGNHVRFQVAAALLIAAAAAFAELGGSYVVPLDHEAIQYSARPVQDAVARLERKLASGEVALEFEENGRGYLRSLLQQLGVPIDSQVLVFSKTSFQAPLISPHSPRALYFSDGAIVGFVRGGDVLELAAVDARLGVIFYTLDNERTAKPRFARRDTCLQCHQSGSTLGVPGLVVRSVYPEPSGMPLFQAGTFVTDHRSPLKERWGGWYVTGTHGAQSHMGNAVVRDRDKPEQLTSLRERFDTSAYLSPHSDIVALMTLEHQTHMTNLITRVGWETRMAIAYQAGINKALNQPEGTMGESGRNRINAAVEEMLRYMLFVEETPLTARITGSSAFAASFTQVGPRNKKGRSLREFDLERRLFRYPLSYMVYSEAFAKMPELARTRLRERLYEVLRGEDQSKVYAGLKPEDRAAVLEILEDTRPAGLF